MNLLNRFMREGGVLPPLIAGYPIRDRAGQRLRKRYRHLSDHGKLPCVAITAVARELAGFIWSVFNEYEARNNKNAA